MSLLIYALRTEGARSLGVSKPRGNKDGVGASSIQGGSRDVWLRLLIGEGRRGMYASA